jgi:tetratricopeptide (TPR) repeat protein
MTRTRCGRGRTRIGYAQLARRGTAAALLTIGTLAAGSLRAEPPDPAGSPGEPRATMHRVFDALSELLPLCLDPTRFEAAPNQPEIARQIGVLASAVRALEQHGEQRDPDFRFLSRSLSEDVEEVLHRYHWGRLEEARFFILEATRNCVACHSRLPSAREFPLADQLLGRVDLDALSHHERGQLYVATRQFDRALTNWEELFAGTEQTPSQLHIGGYLRDYLTVAIRVQYELPRARRTLEKLAADPNLPRYLALRLQIWIRDLKQLETTPAAGAFDADIDLARARALAHRVPAAADVPDDTALAVSDLLASSLLFRFIDTARQRRVDDRDLAEAFYLLGLIEARGVDSYWVPQAEFHLEAAIRLDPKGPIARPAYALLEQSLAIGYGGTSAETLPLDLWTKLNELRALVDAGSTGSSVP